MFDQETCVLLQGCQRQGLYISNYFPWWLAVIVSVHWFVAISFNIYFSKCGHNTVQILGKHFHIVQYSDSKYGKHVYNCFLAVWFNFNQWFWILSEFVCLCQLIFLCEVYYIFGLIQLIQDCTLVKQCFTKHNAVWICWCCDVDHEIGQETSVLF